MIKNTSDAYGSIAKTLHWLIAILVIGMLCIGFVLADLKLPILYKLHKATGFAILLLVIVRIIWRLCNIVPGYEKTMPKLMAFAAHSLHYILYALLILMPLSAFIASNAAGYPVSFLFLFDMPSFFEHKHIELAKELMNIHKFLAFIFVFAVALHIIAALYHHFIRRDNILKRMLPY